jgi:hypothetical protein
MQASAWIHANSDVRNAINILITMSDYRQRCLELPLRARLTLADSIVLVHRLGHTNATSFISVVDPWCYPGEKTQAPCLVKNITQKAVDKAAAAGKRFNLWTEESISAYLCSPLLVQPGERPELIRKGARDSDRSSISNHDRFTTVTLKGPPLPPPHTHTHLHHHFDLPQTTTHCLRSMREQRRDQRKSH